MLAVGPGKFSERLEKRLPILGIGVGMEVIFGRYQPEVEVEGQKVRFIREEDLYGVLEPQE